MRGKCGPNNSHCNYRGLRQRTWGKWVAKICEPNRVSCLWLGSFSTALEAAHAYDEAAKAMYRSGACLNLPESSTSKDSKEWCLTATTVTTSTSESTTTTSNQLEFCSGVEESKLKLDFTPKLNPNIMKKSQKLIAGNTMRLKPMLLHQNSASLLRSNSLLPDAHHQVQMLSFYLFAQIGSFLPQ
ncbi:hypothetical protein NE237_017242 [Protea cynaroides]|uniref:AP2/ERF domain-containing protein n=1 Tax=Protea cynaroides TaxID=273540 RepID=A0A9Q0K7N9_9MAGN|nr:hypothetical protein NE237_017242 [Protea cynaroides]